MIDLFIEHDLLKTYVTVNPSRNLSALGIPSASVVKAGGLGYDFPVHGELVL